jgi:ATP-dependent Clp protease, protease subunit
VAGQSQLAAGDGGSRDGYRRRRGRTAVSTIDPAMPIRMVPEMRAAGAGMNLNDAVQDRLLRERIIFLGQPVDDAIANQICAQLLLLAAEDPKRDINLYINSPGGSVTAGMAIFDTMELIEPDVATWAMGLAASMGQFLLSAGARGKRYALPHARVLMHQGSAGIGGTASDIAIQAEQWNLTKREMAELIAEHTGQPVEQIERDSDRDRWFTAQQALDYGFIDQVVRRAAQVPSGDVSPA